MTTLPSVSIVLFFLAVSIEALHTNGLSSWCGKSRLNPGFYGPKAHECCGLQSICHMYIKPGETKYGLTNPDLRWPRRSCDCDVDLFKCVMNSETSSGIELTRLRGLKDIMCFRMKAPKYRIVFRPIYEFVSLLDAMGSEYCGIGKK